MNPKQLQTVYLPVKIEGELPKEDVLCISEEFNGIAAGKLELNSRSIVACDTDAIGCYVNYISHWLNPTKGYFFTPEQLNQLLSDVIKDALETAAKKANSYAIEGEGGYMEGNIETVIVKQSITNTFEQIYEKWKI